MEHTATKLAPELPRHCTNWLANPESHSLPGAAGPVVSCRRCFGTQPKPYPLVRPAEPRVEPSGAPVGPLTTHFRRFAAWNMESCHRQTTTHRLPCRASVSKRKLDLSSFQNALFHAPIACPRSTRQHCPSSYRLRGIRLGETCAMLPRLSIALLPLSVQENRALIVSLCLS